MAWFVARRLVSMVLVLFAVSVIVFFAYMELPGGDPAQRLAGKDATPVLVSSIRHEWGFDKPLYVQYAAMMRKTLIDRSLVSYTSQDNVFDEIERGLPATVSLALGAGILWFFSGIVIGIVSALWPRRFSALALGFGSLVLVSIPGFWLAVFLRYLLGIKAGILPTDGYVPFTQSPARWFTHLLLPWFVLSCHFTGLYARVLRGSLLETMNEEHVRMARAKGLSQRRVFLRHVLRNSMIPMFSLFTLDFAAVLGGGAILVEFIFGLHGVGQYAATAVGNLDLPPLMAVTLFGAFFIVVFSVVADIGNAWLDPRQRTA
jgi:peptide/nickel transport system permease protein